MISVIICTWNRAKSLEKTLQSILTQEDVDAIAHEVIIVDNRSTDCTKQVAEAFIAECSRKASYVYEEKKGLNHARNRGIETARGDIFAWLDDDVIADPQWLFSVNDFFARHTECDALGGRILPLFPANAKKTLRDNKYVHGPIPVYDLGEHDQEADKPFAGCNMAFRRSCFASCGAFREDLGQGTGASGGDTELFMRLKKHNMKLYYCAGALVWHSITPVMLTYRYIAQRFMQYGRYMARVDDPREQFACWLGIPRYVIRAFLSNLALLSLNLFGKKRFWRYWRETSINLGKFLEYRSQKKCRV